MIINKDINPERDLYYLGALVIEALPKTSGSEADFFEVFQNLKKQENVSLNLYALTLDWLFMLGVISSSNGKIKNNVSEKP
jgi:ABC-3C biological conflict system middle component